MERKHADQGIQEEQKLISEQGNPKGEERIYRKRKSRWEQTFMERTRKLREKKKD